MMKHFGFFSLCRATRAVGALLAAALLGLTIPALAQSAKTPPKTAPAKAAPKAAPKAEPKTAPKTAPKAAAKTEAGPGGGQTFLLDTFGDWKALVNGKDNPKTKVCYVLAQPKERKPATLKRDPAYLFISNRPGDGAKNEVAIKLGFAGKSEGVLNVGAGVFGILVTGESAFLKNPAQEGQLVEVMKKGTDLTIKTASLRGNETTDVYSLNGFGKALERMVRECP